MTKSVEKRALEEERAAEEYVNWRATLMVQANNQSVTMEDLMAPNDEVLTPANPRAKAKLFSSLTVAGFSYDTFSKPNAKQNPLVDLVQLSK